MSEKNRATLLADLLVAFPDNASGLITPVVLRGQQTDIIDSYLNLIDEAIGLISIASEQDWIDNTIDLTGGRRQMGLNASYRLLNPVTRSFTLVCNGVNLIRSENFIVGVDTYSGVINASYESTLATSGILIKNLQCVSLSAPWIDFSSALVFLGSNSTVITKELGQFNASSGSIIFAENFQFGIESDPLTKGLTLSGSGFTVSLANCTTFPDPTETFDILVFGISTWKNIRISDMEFNAGAPNTPMSGLANGGNLIAGGAGFVNHSNFGPATNPLLGISPADDPWIFTGNLGPAESSKSLGAFVENNVSVTAISVGVGDDGNPIAVNFGTSAVSYNLERFTMSTAGLVTYTGTNDTAVNILATGLADTAAGNNVPYTFYIALNGTVIPGSRGPLSLDSADPGRFATQAVVNISTGDTLQVFVEENAGTTNITVSDSSVTIV